MMAMVAAAHAARGAHDHVQPMAIAEPAPGTDSTVPEISRFFGIVIAMYYDDHSPHTFTRATVSIRRP
jgi:hypothetical protein